jgi:hypothetical protein
MSTSNSESTPTTENSPLLVENFCRLVEVQLQEYQEDINKSDAKFSERDTFTIAAEIMTWKNLKLLAQSTLESLKQELAKYRRLTTYRAILADCKSVRQSLNRLIADMNKHKFYLRDVKPCHGLINKSAEMTKRHEEVTRYAETLNRLVDKFSEAKVLHGMRDHGLGNVRDINAKFLEVVDTESFFDAFTYEVDLKAITMTIETLEAFEKQQLNNNQLKQPEQDLLNTLGSRIGKYRELICTMDRIVDRATILRNSCCWGDIKRDGLDYCRRLEGDMDQSRKVAAGQKTWLDGTSLDPRSKEGLEKLKGNIESLAESFSRLQNTFACFSKQAKLKSCVADLEKVINWVDKIAGPNDKVDPSSDKPWSQLKSSIEFQCKTILQRLNKPDNTEDFLNKYIQKTIDMRCTLYEQLEALRKAKDKKEAAEKKAAEQKLISDEQLALFDKKYAEFQSYGGDLQAVILRIDRIAGPDDKIAVNSDQKWSEIKEAIGVKYIFTLQAARLIKSSPAADRMVFLCQYTEEILEMKSILQRHFDAFQKTRDTKDRLLEAHQKRQDRFDSIDKQISALDAPDKQRMGELFVWRTATTECMKLLKKSFMDIMDNQLEATIYKVFDDIDWNLDLLDSNLQTVVAEKSKTAENRQQLNTEGKALEDKFKWLQTGIETILNDTDRENFNKLRMVSMPWEQAKIFCIQYLADIEKSLKSGGDPKTIRNNLGTVNLTVAELYRHYAEVLAQKSARDEPQKLEEETKKRPATVLLANVLVRVFMDDVWRLSIRLDGEATYRISIIGKDSTRVIRHYEKPLEFVHELLNTFRQAYAAKKLEFKVMAKSDTEQEHAEFATFSTIYPDHYKTLLAAALLHFV